MEDFTPLSPPSARLDPDPLTLRRALAAAHLRGPVLWAIDAFPDENGLEGRTASTLETLFPETLVHPVYILSEESFTDRGFSTFLKPALKPMALKSIQRMIHDSRLGGHLRKPRVLIERSASRPACAKKLLRFAQRVRASMIAVGHHGRRGFSRFWIGSFSESLIDHAEIPVLICGPQASPFPRKPKTIVFATDFSEACSAAFNAVIDVAVQFDAEIHLFYKSVNPMDTLMQSGAYMFGGWVSVDAYLGPQDDGHESAVRTYIERAASLGVPVRFVTENAIDSTAAALLHYVERLQESGAMIALVSQTGSIASTFLGSVTRDVIRQSPWPVLVAPAGRRH